MPDEANDEDQRAPLTIKSVRVVDRKEATAWAAREGVTMAELFGRMVRLWANQKSGSQSPIAISRPLPDPPAAARGPAALSHTVELLRETRAVFTAIGKPMPDSLVKEIERLARARMREERGLAPPRRGRRAATIEGAVAFGDDFGPTENENRQTLRLPHKEPV
jgi:hypothetical protein